MKHFLVAALVVGLLVLSAPFAIGSLLPKSHTVADSRTMEISAQVLFAFAVNIDNWPAWRSDVDSITHLEGDDFRAAIVSGDDTIVYEFEADFQGLSMISTIVTKNIPFGGSWEFQVEPAAAQSSQITITERGFVDPPLWRFVSRFVIGHKKSIQRYLDELEAVCAGWDCVTEADRRDPGAASVMT